MALTTWSSPARECAALARIKTRLTSLQLCATWLSGEIRTFSNIDGVSSAFHGPPHLKVANSYSAAQCYCHQFLWGNSAGHHWGLYFDRSIQSQNDSPVRCSSRLCRSHSSGSFSTYSTLHCGSGHYGSSFGCYAYDGPNLSVRDCASAFTRQDDHAPDLYH